MKDLSLPLSFNAVIALASLLSVWGVARQPIKAASPYENLDAYGVYSAVLSMGGQWDDSKSLVILKKLPPKEWPIGSPRYASMGMTNSSETSNAYLRRLNKRIRNRYFWKIALLSQAISACRVVRT